MLVLFSVSVRKDTSHINIQLHGEGKKEVRGKKYPSQNWALGGAPDTVCCYKTRILIVIPTDS